MRSSTSTLLIVNAKGILNARDPWRGTLHKLTEKGLALLQVSLPGMEPQLEPQAPPLAERLSSAAQLAEEGVPVTVRVSPHIPRFSPTAREEVEAFVSVLKEAGVKHLILEFLRGEPQFFTLLAEKFGIEELRELEAYSLRETSGEPSLARVRFALRAAVALAYAETARRAGLTFATCMEGLLELHTAPDCCGAYLLEGAALRTTLGDVYRHVSLRGPTSPLELAAACAGWGRFAGASCWSTRGRSRSP